MRSMRFPSLFLLPTALLVAGCSEQHSPTAADEAGSIGSATVAAANASNRVVLRATGGGILPTPLVGSGAPPGGWRTFSLVALKLADGTATGHMHYNQRSEFPYNTLQHGTVTCVNHIGSGVILISAHGTKRVADADPGPFFGLPPAVLPDNDGMVFAVRDNGEGAGASGPDQITSVVHTIKVLADAICANPAPFGFTVGLAESFFNDVARGNIEVR